MENKELKFSNQSIAPIALISSRGMEDFTQTINSLLIKRRFEKPHLYKKDNTYENISYNFIIPVKTPRFKSGEAKGLLEESVRGKDVYILSDVTNYSITYSLNSLENHMSPDDHFQDLKRIIAAICGKSTRINVIMPFLYEGRQHRRIARESLDCSIALQELINMGVSNIITFDAHDPKICNSIPLGGFETILPTYQFLKNLFKNIPDIKINKKDLIIVSPDEGATHRCIYMSTMLEVNMSIFYKTRDYSIVENGRNPIVSQEFLGDSVENKDVIVIDDIIASGESILGVCKKLKQKKAKRIFILATFGLFTAGFENFDKYYNDKLFDKIITTNLVYQSKELLEKPYYINCDMTNYLSVLIDVINHNSSLSRLLDQTNKIKTLIDNYRKV